MRTKCESFHVLSHATGFYSYRNYMLLFWRHLPINNNAHNDKVWTNLFCLRIHHCIGAIEKYSLRMCQYLQFVWNLWVVRCLQPLKKCSIFWCHFQSLCLNSAKAAFVQKKKSFHNWNCEICGDPLYRKQFFIEYIDLLAEKSAGVFILISPHLTQFRRKMLPFNLYVSSYNIEGV